MKLIKRLMAFSIILVPLLASCATLNLTPAAPLAPPTVNPTTVEQTIEVVRSQVAQTAEVRLTSEASQPDLAATPTLLPTSTPYPTSTPFPTFLPIVYPSATTTSSSSGSSSEATSDPGYSCEVLNTTPDFGTFMEPGTDFDGVFYVKNTGTITWLKSDVDYVYVVGSDFAKHDVYDLPKDVAPGETVKLTVDFLAPYARGDRYVTEWQLKWGKKYWCLMDINIYIPAGPSPTPTGPSR